MRDVTVVIVWKDNAVLLRVYYSYFVRTFRVGAFGRADGPLPGQFKLARWGKCVTRMLAYVCILPYTYKCECGC